MILQTTTDALTPLAYIAGGAALGLTSYTTKHGLDFRELRLRQFVKTLLVYALAGGIVYLQGGALDEPTVTAATALAAPIANQILDAAFAPEAGGSPNRGRGATRSD